MVSTLVMFLWVSVSSLQVKSSELDILLQGSFPRESSLGYSWIAGIRGMSKKWQFWAAPGTYRKCGGEGGGTRTQLLVKNYHYLVLLLYEPEALCKRVKTQ